MPATEEVQAIEKLMDARDLISEQLKKVIIGQEEVIDQMLMTFFAGEPLFARRCARAR